PSADLISTTRGDVPFAGATRTLTFISTAGKNKSCFIDDVFYFDFFLALVLGKLLQSLLRAATNLSAVLLRICPRRCRQPMRIKKGQCLIGKLAGEILLTITQI